MRNLLFLSVMTFATMPLLAQMDAKVTSGVAAYEMGNYQEAYEKLNEALSQPDQIKAKNVAKAYLFRSKAMIEMMKEFAANKDYMGMQEYGSNPYYQCYQDLNSVLSIEGDKHHDEALEELQMVHEYLLQYSATILNAYSASLAPEDQVMILLDAKSNLEACMTIKSDYRSSSLMGQVQTEFGEYEDAANLYKKAIEEFTSDPERLNDVYIGYTYYRLAMLYLYNLADVDAFGYLDPSEEQYDLAIGYVEDGLDVVEAELDILEQKYGDTPEWESTALAGEQVIHDMSAFRLDIFSNAYHRYDEAKVAFSEYLLANQDDYTVWVLYGKLLERESTSAAIGAYNSALNIDPNGFLANFNLGAIYYNYALEYNTEAMETDNFDAMAELSDLTAQNFELAIGHLDKAHLAEPENVEILRSLIQATLFLGQDDKYAVYQSRLDALEQ